MCADSVLTLLLHDFLGEWHIRRTVTDHRGGPNGLLNGVARFRANGTGLDYVETGSLVIGMQPPMQAERRYHWTAKGDRVAVSFADGAPFHAFDLAAQNSVTIHHCDPDVYRGVYHFGSWPEWRLVWNVTGPRKDYCSDTVFQR